MHYARVRNCSLQYPPGWVKTGAIPPRFTLGKGEVMKISARWEKRIGPSSHDDWMVGLATAVSAIARLWPTLPRETDPDFQWDWPKPEAWKMYKPDCWGYLAPIRVYAAMTHNNWDDEQPTCCQPLFWVRQYGQNWLVIKWDDTTLGAIPDHQKKPGELGWLFAFRQTPAEPFSFLPVCAPFSVDPISGQIVYHFEGLDLTFMKDEVGWPWVLQDPQAWVAHGLLRRLLTPETANPLSMLLGNDNSHMVRGTATQLASMLRLTLYNLPDMSRYTKA